MKPIIGMFSRLAAAALFLMLSSCRQMTEKSTDGRSSFTFVEPLPVKTGEARVAEPSNEPIIVERFAEAEPIEPLVPAVYPRIARRPPAPVTVGVEITVDPKGNVTDVGPSLQEIPITVLSDDQFYHAVREAVKQWRFRPAQRYRMRVPRVSEGGGAPYEISRETVECKFILRFTFTPTGAVSFG